MTNNPELKTCPDCGKQYIVGHACVILNLNLTVDLATGDIFIQQVIDANYDIATESFQPISLGKKMKVPRRCPYCDDKGYIERTGDGGTTQKHPCPYHHSPKASDN